MPHWDPDRVDHLEPIEDDEAVEMTLRLSGTRASSPGFDGRERRRGPSPGRAPGPGAVIVTLAVDSGFKYMSVAPYDSLG